jgi:hypothetical protein
MLAYYDGVDPTLEDKKIDGQKRVVEGIVQMIGWLKSKIDKLLKDLKLETKAAVKAGAKK